jgi:hypothetical protein
MKTGTIAADEYGKVSDSQVKAAKQQRSLYCPTWKNDE